MKSIMNCRSVNVTRLASLCAVHRLPSRCSVKRIFYTKRKSRASRSLHQGVYLLDAALPFDEEHRHKEKIENARKLRIGIVGFGKFGQFLAERMIQNGHQISATSKTDYSEKAMQMGVQFFPDANDFAEDHPEIVIFSTSIISMESVLKKFPFHRLRRSTLIVDVLSVKEFPKRLMLSVLPAELDILCTHPMFGPDSGKGSWTGLPFMFDAVRIGQEKSRFQRLEQFIQFFKDEGCVILQMSCEEHDKKTASTQFITHTVGRILGAMNLEKTELDTKGFRSLLSLVDNTSHDSFDLYYGLFMYNQSATEEIDRLERAFELVKKELFHRLHEVARERLFHTKSSASQTVENKQTTSITVSKTNGKKP